eukprot:TRINITY_DN11028_c0_g2_i1.p1 TRINITY_DN11028_c0_g2~~TRINITY_DN11028_c0_g2_i1.p1  ORF type:complete len:512 (+),score=43.12 TRINITY_DN11028_c0_g2_i1:39-1538(+)
MSWECITPEGDAPRHRRAHSSVAVGGFILIFGGRGNVSAQQTGLRGMAIFDTATKKWSFPESPTTPSERWNHSMSVVGENVYLFGGENETELKDDMFMFNMTELAWSEITGLVKGQVPARYAHSTVVYKNDLYVFGGATTRHVNDIQKFDTSELSWCPVPVSGEKPSPRCGHAACVVADKMYVFGGLSTDFVNDLYQFSITTSSWTRVNASGVPPSVRGHLSAVVIASTEMLIFFGGWIQQEPPYSQTLLMNDTHILRLKDMSWKTPVLQGIPPSPRNTHVAVAIGASMYVFGGWDRKTCYNDLFELNLNGFLQHEHETMLSRTFSEKLFNESVFSDVTIEVRGERLSAHRCILAATCQHFQDMFESQMSETTNRVIFAPTFLDDEQPLVETFAAFLKLLYGGPLPSCPILCMEILPLTDYYRCDYLTSACKGVVFRKMSVVNVARIAAHSYRYNMLDVLDPCINFTVANYKEVLPTLIDLPSHVKDRIMQGIIPKMAK